MAEGKVALSPLALLVLGLGAPFVGSLIKDRVSTGENSASIQVQVQSINQALQNHLADSVHRSEFEDLKKMDQSRVSQAEFNLFATQITSDMREIKDMLAEQRKKTRE